MSLLNHMNPNTNTLSDNDSGEFEGKVFTKTYHDAGENISILNRDIGGGRLWRLDLVNALILCREMYRRPSLGIHSYYIGDGLLQHLDRIRLPSTYARNIS